MQCTRDARVRQRQSIRRRFPRSALRYALSARISRAGSTPAASTNFPALLSAAYDFGAADSSQKVPKKIGSVAPFSYAHAFDGVSGEPVAMCFAWIIACSNTPFTFEPSGRLRSSCLLHHLKRPRDRYQVDASFQILPNGKHFLPMRQIHLIQLCFVGCDRVLGPVVPIHCFLWVRAEVFARLLDEKKLVIRNQIVQANELHVRSRTFRLIQSSKLRAFPFQRLVIRSDSANRRELTHDLAHAFFRVVHLDSRAIEEPPLVGGFREATPNENRCQA